MRCRLLPLLFLLLPAATPASAQALVGRVTDAQTGRPLPNAAVEVQTPRGTTHASQTGADGAYRVDVPTDGPHTASVGAVGYRTVTRRVGIEGDTRLDVALTLLPDGEGAVFAVTVDAVGRGVTASPLTVSRLAGADLDRLPQAQDVALQLATQPSVTTYSESGHGIGYTTLRLRGFDERRLAVTVNGQPMNDPEDHAVYWINVMDLQDAIRDVEIQRGAGTAVYGTTGIGGAVNVVVDPFVGDRRASVEVGAGAFGTRQVASTVLTPVGPRVQAFARLSRLDTDGYRCHSWARITRVTGGVKASLTDRQTLRVMAFGGPQEDALAYYGIDKSANDRASRDCADDTQRRYNYGAVAGDVERFHQPFATATHTWIVSPRLMVENTAYATRGAGYFDFDATWRSADYLHLPNGAVADRAAPLYEAAPDQTLFFRAYVDNRRAGWLPRAIWTGGSSRFVLGADLLTHGSLHWGRVEETSIAGVPTGDDAAKAYSYRGGKTHAAVYSSALVRPTEMLAVQGDLSVRRVQYRIREEAYFGRSFDVPYTFVNPRLGATLFPDGRSRVYASVALAQREARLKNYYDADEAGTGAEPLFERTASGAIDYDRPLVKPETAVNVEVGASHESGWGRAAVNGYAYLFRNEIVASGGLDVFGVPRTGNAARTRHVGVEGEVMVRPRRDLVVEASGTLSDDRFVRFTEYGDDGSPVERDGNRIALFPAASARLDVTHHRSLGRVTGGLRFGLRAQGVQPTTNAGTADRSLVLDPYVLTDASAWVQTQPASFGQLRLSVDGHNLFDRKVLAGGNSGGFFPAAGRFAFVSLRWTGFERVD